MGVKAIKIAIPALNDGQGRQKGNHKKGAIWDNLYFSITIPRLKEEIFNLDGLS